MLYIPVVTLSINDNIKFLENIKQRLQRTISWNKYTCDTTAQTKINNDLIDPTFRNINRLFVLSFRNGNDDPMRDSSNKYYMPLVEIKDFKALINNNPFLIGQQKTNRKHQKNLLQYQEMMTIQQEIY